MRHPAKYSKELLPILAKYVVGSSVLDPFAGTGKLRDIAPNAMLLEIEPEWAAIENAIIGDATKMPFKPKTFDTICTSPTYGNRMADHFIDHQKEKKYTRNTYRHCLGRELNKNNSGRMQWGNKYKDLHTLAWIECKRVLKSGGIFILNISNHIRAGKEVDVTAWHLMKIKEIGFFLLKQYNVETKRNRNGANYKNRVSYESVFVFKKTDKQTAAPDKQTAFARELNRYILGEGMMDKNYEGDVWYDVWMMGGNPDLVDRDRVEDDYEERLYSEEAAQRELNIQRRKI